MQLVLIPFFANCQNEKIDSLKSLLKIEADGGKQIDILFQLSRECLDFNNVLGAAYGRIAFIKAKDLGDSFRIVKTGRIYSQGLRRLGKMDSALMVYTKVLAVAKRQNYNDEVKYILNGLGLIHFFMGRYDKALEFNFECLDLKKKDGDSVGVSVTLNNIGLFYHHLNDYERALYYYKESLRLKKLIKDTTDLDALLLNMSQCYALQFKFNEALHYVDRGLKTCGGNCIDETLIIAYQTLGYISYFKKNYKHAEVQFLKAYSLSNKKGSERYKLENIKYLVKICMATNGLSKAEKYLQEAEKLISSGSPYNEEILQIYEQLHSLYAKFQNFKKGYYYQNKYVVLKDSIYNHKLTTNLMKIQAEHLEKENKAKIEAQNAVLVLNEEVILRQKYVNVFIGIVALLLVALAVVLFRSNRQKQRLNLLLDRRVKERTQELESSRDVLQRACEERDIVMIRATSDLKRSLATIKGLCLLGAQDADEARHYLEKVGVISGAVSDVINKLSYNSKTPFSTHQNYIR
ncbi:tetratricopeptide repeat protein [Chryseolinea sp. H1M3-3]|uniref:tetratricopeptide repeat protein n=1 Tax=Chryseolinea sp. H1M3-3 TaxID=3034144 RepID=UPI0023EB28CC|nr:tetratricopeptide repeat protein [Chryseolinea sp. H1M3-3]